MSITELKRWEIRCDRCEKTVIIESPTEPDLPKGWTMRDFRASEASGFLRWSDLCETCAAEVCEHPLPSPTNLKSG